MKIATQWMLAAAFAAVAVGAVLAQDTRTVTQPVFPTICTTLYAEIAVTNGDLSSTANEHFDTTSVQTLSTVARAEKALRSPPAAPIMHFSFSPLRFPRA
jgi:hypothetical protein